MQRKFDVFPIVAPFRLLSQGEACRLELAVLSRSALSIADVARKSPSTCCIRSIDSEAVQVTNLR